MSNSSPILSTPGIIKPKFDEILKLVTGREENLVEVRDALKKENEYLESCKSRMEIRMRNLEMELEEKERICQQMEKRLAQLEEINDILRGKKLKKLKRRQRQYKELCTEIDEVNKRMEENFEVMESVDKMRVKKMGSDMNAQRLHDLEPSTINKAILVSADSMPLEIHDDSGGIGSSKKGAKYSVIRWCYLGVIEDIKKHLGKENLNLFEQSCFGHLLKINQLQFHDQLMLQLLCHMDMGASNQEERLVFKINNSDLEFGVDDFHRITGLNCGSSTSEAESFVPLRCRSGFCLKDVAERFREVSNDDNDGDETPLQWALLYFLYGTLLASRRDLKKIDLEHLKLFEDPSKYNTFPWGRIAFKFLASSIFNARKCMDGSEVSRKRKQITIHGFVFALQIWAYEKIPRLAKRCAVRAHNFETLSPNILRWKTAREASHLEEFFAPDVKTRSVRKGKSKRSSSSSSSSSSSGGEDRMVRNDNDDEMGGRPKAKCGEDLIGGWSKKRERSSIQTKAVAANQDSDEESLSDSHMNNLVAKIECRRT